MQHVSVTLYGGEPRTVVNFRFFVKAAVPKAPTFIMPRKEFHSMRHVSVALCGGGSRTAFMFWGRESSGSEDIHLHHFSQGVPYYAACFSSSVVVRRWTAPRANKAWMDHKEIDLNFIFVADDGASGRHAVGAFRCRRSVAVLYVGGAVNFFEEKGPLSKLHRLCC